MVEKEKIAKGPMFDYFEGVKGLLSDARRAKEEVNAKDVDVATILNVCLIMELQRVYVTLSKIEMALNPASRPIQVPFGGMRKQ